MFEKIIKFFFGLNEIISFFEKALLLFLLFSMLGLSLWQIFSRNLLSGGIFWIDHVLRIEVLWIAFVGASLAFEYRRHIKIDLIFNILEDKKKRDRVSLFAAIASLVISLFLLAASVDYLKMVAGNERLPVFGSVPDWFFRLVIPYSFLVMALRSFLDILRLFSCFPHVSEKQ